MDGRTQKKLELVEILKSELVEQKENLEQISILRIGLIGQLNLIVEIKRVQQNKYQLRNANNLNSSVYDMDKHFTGFNYWRNA